MPNMRNLQGPQAVLYNPISGHYDTAAVDGRTRRHRSTARRCTLINIILLIVIVLLEINAIVIFTKVYGEVKASGFRASLTFIMVTACGMFLLTKILEWLVYVNSGRPLSFKELNCSMALLVWSTLGSTSSILFFSNERIIFDVMLETFVVLAFILTVLLLVKVNSDERYQQRRRKSASCWNPLTPRRTTNINADECENIFDGQWI